MGKIKSAIMVLFFLLTLVPFALGDVITLEWDANDPAPDGYRLYQKETGQDYGESVWEGTEPKAMINISGRNNEAVVYNFVVRAFIGPDESQNSNEVSYTVDRVVPEVPIILESNYDKLTNEITVSWIHEQMQNVAYWKVFYSEIPGGPYVEFAKVDNTGIGAQEASNHLEVTAGQVKTFYFVVVAFKTDTVYSANSEEISQTIDKQGIVPVINLKITVIIKE